MNAVRICTFFLAVTIMAAQAPIARAVDVTITMDDLPLQPVDGLLHPSGVQFGFTVGGVPNLDARYASSGPGIGAFVQDPSIEGTTAGVLSIIFPLPTSIVEFGVARSTTDPVPLGAAVELFDASNASLGVSFLALNPLPLFAEGQFSYSGTPVKRATVDFTTDAISPRFAFDNLRFRPVPEPATWMLAGLAAAFGTIRLGRRRDRDCG